MIFLSLPEDENLTLLVWKSQILTKNTFDKSQTPPMPVVVKDFGAKKK
jgi:hypothetical protein